MNVLDQIFAAKRAELVETKSRLPLRELKSTMSDLPPTRGFARALVKAEEIAIIAEIKFQSPSEGRLRMESDVESIAQSYAAAGAAALSVLTESRYFGGDIAYLQRAGSATAIPRLRKDFLFDEYQMYESRTCSADAVLLIAAMLARSELLELSSLATDLGLDVLLEVHDETDLEKSEGIDGVIWGVNHRNLKTLAIDLDTSARLIPQLPGGAVIVAESGIETGEQLRMLESRGAQAALIGSVFMRASDPGVAVARLLHDYRAA